MMDAEYGAGAFAYIDTLMSGLVPCKVVEVRQSGSGRQASSGVVLAKVTADRRGYKRGEFVFGGASHIVPRDRVRRSKHATFVSVDYTWR